MASDPQDPFALNIRGVTDLVENKTNKTDASASESKEGIVGDKYGSLELKMSDEELIKLKDEWEKKYATYENTYNKIVERNKESYLGKRKDGQWLAGEDNIAANIQFEAEETFLASTLAKKPDPVVFADNTQEGNAISTSVRTMLQFHAQELALRRKLSMMVRQWSIYHLGVLKFGWNSKINDVAVSNRRIQDFIFDPHGYVDAHGDFVGYLGERITVTADKLKQMFPDASAFIDLTTESKDGTECIYTEWWTDEFCFTTFKTKVLDKHKNEYFKYEEPQVDEQGQPALDEMGQPVVNTPRNHFAAAKKPYIFLSVYSLQEQPHDITGLIEQNIPNQRLITRRTDQIDFNASSANNSYAFSEDNFNQETAKQAANARRKGNPLIVPSGGPIANAIMPLNAQPLPPGLIESTEIAKNDLRTSWGVQGITAQPEDEDQTARGMILNQSHDTSRIGGGIGEAIEQVAAGVFNWLTQLYYVFYDEAHFAAIMGTAKAVEYVTLTNSDLDRQIIVGVSPDSMKPKDEVSNMNMAQALYDKGAIGPKVLLKMVDFPNPDESAADGALWQVDKMAYLQLNFPDLFMRLQQAQAQMVQAAGGGAPGEQPAPEGITEPPQDIAQDPASAALSEVPLPQ